MDEQEVNTKLVLGTYILSKSNACKFLNQTKCMQDMDGQGANAKLVLGTISFPNQMHAIFFHQTKCMQDMDEQKAHAKLVLLSKPNAGFFHSNQMHAGHG